MGLIMRLIGSRILKSEIGGQVDDLIASPNKFGYKLHGHLVGKRCKHNISIVTNTIQGQFFAQKADRAFH